MSRPVEKPTMKVEMPRSYCSTCGREVERLLDEYRQRVAHNLTFNTGEYARQICQLFEVEKGEK